MRKTGRKCRSGATETPSHVEAKNQPKSHTANGKETGSLDLANRRPTPQMVYLIIFGL